MDPGRYLNRNVASADDDKRQRQGLQHHPRRSVGGGRWISLDLEPQKRNSPFVLYAPLEASLVERQ
jgi:hypothetical protein